MIYVILMKAGMNAVVAIAAGVTGKWAPAMLFLGLTLADVGTAMVLTRA